MHLAFLIVPNITAAIRVALGQWKMGMKGWGRQGYGGKATWDGLFGCGMGSLWVMVGVVGQGE